MTSAESVPAPSSAGATVLDLEIRRQPDDATCGPTCLHAVYRYYGDLVPLEEVVATAPMLPGDGAARGTLAVMLGIHALRRGYDASIYTFNLQMFDPTWFAGAGRGRADPAMLREKLRAQCRAKADRRPRLGIATEAYLEFLSLGGSIWFRDLTSGLLSRFIRARRPVLTGLSSTYLYRCAREWGPNDDFDDVRGEPVGHFVVLHGYDPPRRLVTVADPLEDNPAFAARRYTVPMARLVGAIMLGVLTYDANLLIVEPRAGSDQASPEPGS